MTSDVISPPREAVAQQEKYERGHTLGIWFYHANWFATLPSLVRVGSTASTYFLRSPWSAVGEADLSREVLSRLSSPIGQDSGAPRQGCPPYGDRHEPLGRRLGSAGCPASAPGLRSRLTVTSPDRVAQSSLVDRDPSGRVSYQRADCGPAGGGRKHSAPPHRQSSIRRHPRLGIDLERRPNASGGASAHPPCVAVYCTAINKEAPPN